MQQKKDGILSFRGVNKKKKRRRTCSDAGSHDFISSCSPQVCGGNTGQHISMGRQKSLEKEPITGKKIKWHMRNETDLIIFYFLFVFSPLISSRACCIGWYKAEREYYRVMAPLSTTAACLCCQYFRVRVLVCLWCCVCAGRVGGLSNNLYSCSKLSWGNINCV